jgi:hypothetical protein
MAEKERKSSEFHPVVNPKILFAVRIVSWDTFPVQVSNFKDPALNEI